MSLQTTKGGAGTVGLNRRLAATSEAGARLAANITMRSATFCRRVRKELHSLQNEELDRNFLATSKGMRYRT